MKWKVATASVLAAAIVSAPVASAAPGSGNNGGNGARNTIGQTISAIAKNGGGAVGILGALVQLKPNNKGLANAVQRLLSHQTPAPTPATPPAG